MSRKLRVPLPREPAPSLQLLHNDPRDGGIGGAACVPGAAHGCCFIQLSQQPHEGGIVLSLEGSDDQGPQQAEPGSKADQVLGSSLSLPLTCPVSLRACWSVHLGVASLSSLSLSPHPHGLHRCVYPLHNSDLSFRVAFWEPSLPTPLKKRRPYKSPLVVLFLHTSDTCLLI